MKTYNIIKAALICVICGLTCLTASADEPEVINTSRGQVQIIRKLEKMMVGFQEKETKNLYLYTYTLGEEKALLFKYEDKTAKKQLYSYKCDPVDIEAIKDNEEKLLKFFDEMDANNPWQYVMTARGEIDVFISATKNYALLTDKDSKKHYVYVDLPTYPLGAIQVYTDDTRKNKELERDVPIVDLKTLAKDPKELVKIFAGAEVPPPNPLGKKLKETNTKDTDEKLKKAGFVDLSVVKRKTYFIYHLYEKGKIEQYYDESDGSSSWTQYDYVKDEKGNLVEVKLKSTRMDETGYTIDIYNKNQDVTRYYEINSRGKPTLTADTVFNVPCGVIEDVMETHPERGLVNNHPEKVMDPATLEKLIREDFPGVKTINVGAGKTVKDRYGDDLKVWGSDYQIHSTW